MNKKNIVFADIEKAKDIIKVQYPNAKNISFVENGYDNLVILIDKTYVLRFPRNKKAYIKSKYERIILKSLDTISYIGIPKLLGEGLNPPYLIETFLNGVHLKSEEIDEFTLPLQQEFGSSVGTFAFNIHKTLSITHIELFMKKFQISPVSWNEYFNSRIVKHSFLSSRQYKLAKGCYEEWIKLNKINQKLVVIHDDLHTDNMLFENKKLTGVLDFADTNNWCT